MIDTPEQDDMPDHWKPIGRSGAITRRFEFANYAATSAFLDALNAFSEECGLYPDLGFATRHVIVTIPAGEETGESGMRNTFARKADSIYESDAQ